MAMSEDSILLSSLIPESDVDVHMGDPGWSRRNAEKRSSREATGEDMGRPGRRRRTGSGLFFFVLSGSLSFIGERDGERTT
jgi:hypothetical protein